MNAAQTETYEMLLSVVDGIETETEDDGAIVFSGEGQDGPAVGYIETDGKVNWVVGA